MKYLIKIDRFCAWILFIGMTLYFISGYGMTKGIIDANYATKIHIDWLSIFIIIAFVFHAGFATRLALIRWKGWNRPTQVVWLAFFVLFLLSFIYLDRYYHKPVAPASNPSHDIVDKVSPIPSSMTSPSTTPLPNQSQTKIFTNKELAKYDGQNGNPAYTAVDGLVYDMSAVFVSGSHFSHLAGTELTDAFYMRHPKSAITKYPVVGEYKP